MWWLFVRDFYRAGNGAVYAAVSTAPHRGAQVAAVAFRELPEPSLEQSPIYEAVEQAVSEPAFDQPPSMMPYLQRLSVDGEHAFGLWDSDSGFSVFSANFERVTQLPTSLCAGHAWIHAIHHDHQYAMNEALMSAERDGRTGQCLIQSRGAHDGEYGWLLIDIKPPSPRQPCVMMMVRNISTERALEEALAKTEAALAISDRGRSAFLSSMSHELRTPLNAIMGFSEMMKSGVFGELNHPTYKQYAEHIHNSGELLLSKVNDLLDIASMDADGLELEETHCNLQELLGEVIEIHSHAAFARHIQPKIDCGSGIVIEADRAKLICILSHFMSNALRHSKDDSEITLTARTMADDGLVLCVRDHGDGIAPAQLNIIRDALQCDDSYLGMEPGGIGLGLSLSRELAVRHGGRIVVDSIRHRGTAVSLMLPVARVVRGMPMKKRKGVMSLVH